MSKPTHFNVELSIWRRTMFRQNQDTSETSLASFSDVV